MIGIWRLCDFILLIICLCLRVFVGLLLLVVGFNGWEVSWLGLLF